METFPEQERLSVGGNQNNETIGSVFDDSKKLDNDNKSINHCSSEEYFPENNENVHRNTTDIVNLTTEQDNCENVL